MNTQGSKTEPALMQITADLLREPFAQMCGLAHMSLEQASELFESSFEELDEGQRESYESAKAIFCMMLLEIEQAPQNWLTLTLEQLGRGELPEAPSQSPEPSEETYVGEGDADPYLTSTSTATPPPPPAYDFSSTEAHEYLWIADQIANVARAPGSEDHHPILVRVLGQQLCFAIELETQKRLAAGLNQFAQMRGEIHEKLFSDRHLTQPSRELQTALDALIGMAKSAGKENNFDMAMITYALKYLSLSSSSDLSRPSLVEMGVFLVFFCGALEQNGWDDLSIDIPGLDVQRRMELGLHLIRLQTLRNHTLNLHLPLSFAQSEEIQKRCETCFALLSDIGNGPAYLRKAG